MDGATGAYGNFQYDLKQLLNANQDKQEGTKP